MYHIFVIHPPVDGYLGGVHFLVIVCRIEMDVDVQASLWKCVESLGSALRSAISES